MSPDSRLEQARDLLPEPRHATGNADEVRSGVVITGRCGPILLPPRCLEIKKA
jgi:hypothetical protein